MNRHAFAMLFVLGSLVVILSLTTIIARSRATDSIAARSSADMLDAMTIAESAHDPILAWLDLESGSVSIDPESTVPMVPVLGDSIRIDGKRARITVTAWDQFGMLSKGEQSHDYQNITGLDELAAPVSVFPSDVHPDRPGARIATHNPIPGQQTRGNAAPSVNLNTTPAARLEQLFQEYHIAGLDAVLASRADREQARGASIRIDGQAHHRFVSSSQSWGIRTDVRFGLASVSLWSVYVQRGGVWMLEQRVVIPD